MDSRRESLADCGRHKMVAHVVSCFADWMEVLAQRNVLVTLVAALTIAALCSLLIAALLRLLKWLLAWLLLAGVLFFCWKTGLLQPLWQWLNLAR